MDTIKEALTFDDVLLLPIYSNVLPSNTSIFLNLSLVEKRLKKLIYIVKF